MAKKFKPLIADYKGYALACLETCRGDLEAAAKLAGVRVDELRFWAQGGDENTIDFTVPEGVGRPRPPAFLCDEGRYPEKFAPALDVAQWMQATFIQEGAPLHNPDHWHLTDALIGVVWTNMPNARQGRVIAGTAELALGAGGNRWGKGREAQQLEGWFGEVPRFLITLDSVYAASVDDATFCALLEHELYHCAIKTDEFGSPKFDKDGNPSYCMKGHDCEEFVGVVSRYGSGAAAGGVAELVAAANRKPSVALAAITSACGTCLR